MHYNVNPDGHTEICYHVADSEYLLLLKARFEIEDTLTHARNVYFIREDTVVWQISANDDYDGWSFMEIDKDRDGQFWGYKMNEYMYLIDMKTGHASQEYYLRFESVPNLLNIKPISIEKLEEE